MGIESGYASGASSQERLPQVMLTKAHLKHINASLNQLSAIDILRFCKLMLPNLYQTTAFGLSGLVTLDLVSKIHQEDSRSASVDVIFLDTLYHFRETLDLIEKIKSRYPNTMIHIYKPDGIQTTAEFEAKHGKELWKSNAELYDWTAKVEPAERAYADLSVTAVLTGRRRSQGAKRESLDIIEVTDTGLIKVNPLAAWTFEDVRKYIEDNDVPFNALLDRGYKSIGDWHSTEPVKVGEDERAGRWKGQEKTECGIHNKKSRYSQFLEAAEGKQKQEALADIMQQRELHDEAISGVHVF